MESPICGLATAAEYLYILVPQVLSNIEFLAHVSFTCIKSTFTYPRKEFLTQRQTRPAPSLTPRPLRMHSSAVSRRTRPANASTAPATVAE